MKRILISKEPEFYIYNSVREDPDLIGDESNSDISFSLRKPHPLGRGGCHKKGLNPKLLIHSGTHGDEFEIIDLVIETVKKYEKFLPSFIFVPEVSPSAVKNKTRNNNLGSDINRIFFSDSKDKEVQLNLSVMQNNKFELFVSFHEDPGIEDYYIYDSGYEKAESAIIKKHNKKLRGLGIKLLNGLDDPEDVDLGYEFKDGYRKFIHKEGKPDNGMITIWTLNRQISKTDLIPEIPGKLNIDKKRLIIDTFFSDVIITYFAH